MARVNAGAMSRDDYDKKYKLGKYSPAGSKLSGPGGLYKNLVKEVLNPDDDASVWIDDFVKSDDPRFEGKSKEERIKMALGAWYAAQKKESTEPTTEVLEEAAMTAAEKKIAQEVHDALKDGEQVGQTYGMQIRSQHNKLTSKFGKDWRKIAGIKEETLDERVRMQLVFKAADAVTALEDEEFEEFLKRLADKLERTGKKAGYKDAVNVASLLKKAYGTWKARKDTKDWKEDTKEQGEALQEAVYPLTKKALDATFNLDPDEFEEFLKELAKNLNNEGDDTGYDEWYQVADHIEKAHMIWKKRDSNI